MSSLDAPYSTVLARVLATAAEDLRDRLGQLCLEECKQIALLAASFLEEPVTPEAFLGFEQGLQDAVRELGRKVMELSINECDPKREEDAPHDVTFDAGSYRRMNRKTRKTVDTMFGSIVVWRRGYRYWHGHGEPAIFPLDLMLGTMQGSTPALAQEVGRMMAADGATQNRAAEQVGRQFDVGISIGRLRQLTATLSETMEQQRHHFQVQKLQDLLQQAYRSKGRRKPVFSVGRDGITVPTVDSGYKVASTATIAVYDRRGKRLGTVYLAHHPESLQPTLTEQLSALIKDCLTKWVSETGRPLPRLCYVTDAGDNECSFFAKVLCRMRTPQDSRKYLPWHRIVDYFHTAQRITTMAECLFGPGPAASSWSRRMRKLLGQPKGAGRVLRSAAAMKSCHGLDGGEAKFEEACNFIRSRSQHMQYAEFRKLGLPIGSGVTEAACKTVFTQRIKLSGMRWNNQGMQAVLNLRVILLSGIWDDVYSAAICGLEPVNLKVHSKHNADRLKIAA
jgi:hypothetical protein